MVDHSMSERAAVSDCSHAVVRPPVLYLSALLAAWLLSVVRPIGVTFWGGTSLGAMIMAVGLVVFIAAMRQFSRAGTNVPTTMPTTAIVTSGIYGYSRNPIYLGMTLFYVGLGLLMDNIYALVLFVPVLLVMRYGVIGREEAYLAEKFPDEYVSYKERVRRWL